MCVSCSTAWSEDAWHPVAGCKAGEAAGLEVVNDSYIDVPISDAVAESLAALDL